MGKTAFIFPGQGAQKAGMGKDFYEKYDTAKDVFDSAGEWLDLDMKALCFEENDRLHYLSCHGEGGRGDGTSSRCNCRIKPWRVLRY